jgi:4'-phosphopantetheinyl transferase
MSCHPSSNNCRIDLWYVLLEKISEPALWDRYRALLPDEEIAQERRFTHQPSRLLFLASRALMRTVVSTYTGEDPRGVKFERNRYGKPALQAPARRPLEFNLSNTRGLVVCAVSLRHAVGVDVEPSVRDADHLGLARHYFAAAEVAALESLPPPRRAGAFIEFWTLKEAFIKARGMGLSLPLDSFAFSLAPDRAAQISFPGAAGPVRCDWQFAQLQLGGRYQIALAVEAPASRKLVIEVRETIPLRWQAAGRLLPDSPVNRWVL